MTRLEIVVYPHPALRRKSEEVVEFNEEMRVLAKDMLETMYNGAGVGLAAPQVGINKRLLVLDVEQTEAGKQGNPYIIFNPEIIKRDGEIEFTEGCLSLPGLGVQMRRSEKVTVKYQDESGTEKEVEAEGLLSICLQHEMDHLDGRLLVDYISEAEITMYEKELKKICERK